MSFKKDFRIISLEKKIGLKKELPKKTGARQRCDWLAQWKNGSWHWTGAGRGNEMGREKQAGRGKLGPKSNGNIENSF
jgi:hypothetical protein